MMSSFWIFSNKKKIPYRRSGKLLIAFWSPKMDFDSDSWDRLIVSKRQNEPFKKSQDKILPLEEGMQIQRLGYKWYLTEGERELIEKVNWWLKKYIKSGTITRKEFYSEDGKLGSNKKGGRDFR